jgi:hypothetical protein
MANAVDPLTQAIMQEIATAFRKLGGNPEPVNLCDTQQANRVLEFLGADRFGYGQHTHGLALKFSSFLLPPFADLNVSILPKHTVDTRMAGGVAGNRSCDTLSE